MLDGDSERDLEGCEAIERLLPVQCLPQQYPKGVHVALDVVWMVLYAFGRRLLEIPATLYAVSLAAPPSCVSLHRGEAKVGQLRMECVVKHHVLRLHVLMHEADGVEMGQPISGLVTNLYEETCGDFALHLGCAVQ